MDFIEGINVLNVIPHYGVNILFKTIGLLSFFMIPVSIGLFGVFIADCRKGKIGVIFTIIIIIINLVGIGVTAYDDTHRLKYMSYQCTFDDTLDMQEFTEKYIIIGQNGKLFEIIVNNENESKS